MQHIGIIIDGNRRWARSHKMELYQGHNSGAEKFGHVCDWCLHAGVPYLTVYAFSTENWKRSDKEISHLFRLMEDYFIKEKTRCVEKGIRVSIIGDRSRLTPHNANIIGEMESATAHCTTLRAQIALSYGGRDEILRAAKKFATDVAQGKTTPDALTEAAFENYLDTAGIPDIDLVIRTGGAENRRLSNFLPWQTVYAELFFSDLLWPEFTQDEFDTAIEYYRRTKRKLGK